MRGNGSVVVDSSACNQRFEEIGVGKVVASNAVRARNRGHAVPAMIYASSSIDSDAALWCDLAVLLDQSCTDASSVFMASGAA